MIDVVWWPKYCRLTVKGHARSAEEGKDLICAGASTLAATMAANAEYMEERGMLREKTVRLDKGDAEIQCVPVAQCRAIVRLCMESIVVGFEMLAAEYPGYIRVECLG